MNKQISLYKPNGEPKIYNIKEDTSVTIHDNRIMFTTASGTIIVTNLPYAYFEELK